MYYGFDKSLTYTVDVNGADKQGWDMISYLENTVECRYNAVQYNTMMYK